MSKYKEHLEQQAKTVGDIRKQLAPCRSVGENAIVEMRQRCPNPMIETRKKYSKIDAKVKAAGLDQPVFFDEETDVEPDCFKCNYDRYKFFHDLQLTVPVLLIKYCPGGSIGNTHILICLILMIKIIIDIYK